MVREPVYAAAPARVHVPRAATASASAPAKPSASAAASASASAAASVTGSVTDAAPSSVPAAASARAPAAAYGEASARPSDGNGSLAQSRPAERAKTKSKATGGTATAKPDLYRRTPDVGTPEWEAQQAEEARQQKHLDGAIKSICRGC